MKILLQNTCLAFAMVLLSFSSWNVNLYAGNADELLDLYLETGALEFADQIRADFPGSSYEKFCDAWAYLGANNDRSREVAAEIVMEDPDFAPGHFVMGTVLSDGFKEYKEAISSFNKSLELDPEFFLSYMNRGIALVNLEDYQAARDDFEKVLKLKRGYAEGYLWRGVSNHGLGDDEAMKADFEIGLQMNFMALAKVSNKLAQEAMNQAIEASPDNAIYYYARGYSFFVNGNYRLASSDFSTLIEMVPGSSDFYKYAGASKMYLEYYEGAQKDLNYALSVNPDDPEIYYFLGILMSDFLNQAAMASEYFNHAIELDDFSARYFYERSRSAYQMMNYEQALSDANQAIMLDYRKGDFYALRGNIKIKMDKPAEDYCPDFKQATDRGTSYNLKRVLKKSCRE